MHKQHTEPSENRLFLFERQEVDVQDFDSTGRILDIGGGGEGIIGRLKGGQSSPLTPTEPNWKKRPMGR